MFHSEEFRNGWRLTVTASPPGRDDDQWTVRATLEKSFRPPPRYTYSATAEISQFDRHLEDCRVAWEHLEKAKAAAELGLQVLESVQGLWVSPEGVETTAAGPGKFERSVVLFNDADSYQRHQELIEHARARTEEVANALVQLGEIPSREKWRLAMG